MVASAWRLSVRAWLSVVALCAVASFGEASPGEEQAGRGIVFIVEGVGGWDLLKFTAPVTLPHAGVPHEVMLFVWTHGWGQMFKDLQDRPHLLVQADRLAGTVRRYRAENPGRPIYLVG